MRILITVIISIALAYIIYDFVSEYAKASGSTWERLISAGKGSATILWARFTFVIGALIDLLIQAADYLNIPGVSDAVKSYLSPQTVSLFVIFVAVVSEWARRRTKGQ